LDYYFEILEFDKIIPLINKYVKTYPGIREIGNIREFIKSEDPETELKLTEEMTSFLKFDSDLSFKELENIEDSIENARIKGLVLPPEDVLEIKKTMGIFSGIFNALTSYSIKYPLLFSLVKDAPFPAELLNAINLVMDDNGSIFDSASEELKRIRKRKSSIRTDIHSELSSIMEQKSLGEALQDKFISLREGRFVIPVKAQFKNKLRSLFNYIVHSFSKSGETVYVEPENIISLNNEMVEIDEIELAEINRILLKITAFINENADILLTDFNLIGRLELIYAKARFAIDHNCNFPEIIRDKTFISLRKAYHPLLGNDSIPIDIEVGSTYQGLIISGPNAGGKTVALKTAGLLTLMTLCGIPIPASRSSRVGIFTKIMAEIGDEQNISENLSSFSGHIVNISKMISECNDKSLILIDEIASSTEPKEGEALGRSILHSLLEKGSKFIITTHFQALKEISFSDKRVKNASVDFDEERLVPLYTLKTGTSGSSYALRIAKKYGLDKSIIENAAGYLNERTSSAESLMIKLEKERTDLLKMREIAENNMEESRTIKERYENLLKEMENEKLALKKKGTRLLRNELDDTLKELSVIKEDLKQKTRDSLANTRHKINNIEKIIKDSEEEILRAERKHPQELTSGQRVFVGGFNKEGYIEQVLGNKVRVRLGIISTIVSIDDIYLSEEGEKNKKNSIDISLSDQPQLQLIIDVRGKTAEEALRIVERNIDLAYMKGTASISIIHGKGEGILKKEIWKYLQEQDNILSFSFAKPEDGGQGKTIVLFK